MKEKLRISAISYLNTKPFLYGLYAKNIDDWAEIKLDLPSVCAQRLKNGQADIGLVPVAALPDLPDMDFSRSYCIGAWGAVQTVAIFSEQPLEKLKYLYLDYQSRSSVALAKFLLRDFWQLKLEFLPAHQGYEQGIGGEVGGVIIGDRTIGLNFSYQYDLAEAWTQHTGLPFVFAVWAHRRDLPLEQKQALEQALGFGVSHRNKVAQLFASAYPNYDVEAYYNRYLRYEWVAEMDLAIDLFLKCL